MLTLPEQSTARLTTITRPEFRLPHAQDLLTFTTPRHVHVVVAAPGQGKSRFMREAIASAIKAGTLRHVLWATQSIVGEASLGHEALEHFHALEAPAEIVIGKAAFRPSRSIRKYEQQFMWPTEPVVKIISHARIPLIFGNDPVSPGLRGADLLVIDEDPSSGLLLASPIGGRLSERQPYRLDALSSSGDPVLAALSRVAGAVIGTKVPQPFAQHNTYTTGHGLYSRSFWELFLREHPASVDVASLSAALEAGKIGNAALIAQEFAEDARLAAGHGGRYRSRFGLHWVGSDFKVAGATPPSSTGKALLRFNLRHPLTLNLPVFVLDGYAHQALYTSLFKDQASVQFHEFSEGARLQVECSDLLNVDPAQERTEAAKENRRQVADELAEQRKQALDASPDSQQLIIANMKMTRAGSDWQTILEEAYGQHGLSLNTSGGDLDQMYWHAGRGLNAFAGADVYAVNLPHLSVMNREYALAAVYPDDPATCQLLHEHAAAAELLQMLNRGRQPTFSAGKRPRIVVGASEDRVREQLGRLQNRVTLAPYTPQLLFKKGSQNPRWRDMTAALGHELLEHFKLGLPTELLRSLPKASGSGGRADITTKLSDLALKCAPTSHLYQAFHRPQTWIYRSVRKGGSSKANTMLNEAMTALELTPLKRVRSAGQPNVYMPAGGDPEKAGQAFEAWLRDVAAAPPLNLVLVEC